MKEISIDTKMIGLKSIGLEIRESGEGEVGESGGRRPVSLDKRLYGKHPPGTSLFRLQSTTASKRVRELDPHVGCTRKHKKRTQLT